MQTNDAIIFTNDNCIGCNRCISVCSSNGACVAVEEDGKHRIRVDANRCVGCGACLDVCEHKAREYRDDTERFFADLKSGKQISVLIAPAFKANYPHEYSTILGYIHSCGANRFINVSFGADIATWGYVNYIKKYNFSGGISQPCPAVVAYVEKYLPELINNLIPVQSPLMCAAIYARKNLGITDSLAFISPCIAKKMEIDDPVNSGNVEYNVTFRHLIEYINAHPLPASSYDDEISYGLGSVYPMPGGLKENIRWFLGEDAFVRQMDGEKRMYRYLEKNKSFIKEGLAPFLLVDALNCSNGCIYGTGCEPQKNETDAVLFAQMKIRSSVKADSVGTPWDGSLSLDERLAKLNEQFAGLDLNDYLRKYTDLSENCKYTIPSEAQRNEIFESMGKHLPVDRMINCASCGYDSCTQMVDAIFNGFNTKENCVNYLRYEIIEEAKKSAAMEASNEAKSVFLANVSHEMRTPLNGVLGMNSMILKESTDSHITRCAQVINSAGKSLLNLINDILDISKIEAGKLVLNEENYNFILLARECFELNSFDVKRKNLEFSLHCAKPVPFHLAGDEERVRQILENLISNAIKYTTTGFVRVNIDWERHSEDSIKLLICVEDSGQGIDSESIKHLFVSFNRFNEDINKAVRGGGLGLPISKTLAEMMGGTIEVESTVGVGSKFTASVIQKIVDNEVTDDFSLEENLPKKKESGTEFKAPNLRILAVDDTPVNLKVIKGLLKQSEIIVDEAESGPEALECTLKFKYDLILMDHMMPGMDGEETLERIRAQEDGLNHETPIIVQTANAMQGAREQYLDMGFSGYLSKPIVPVELINLIKNFI